MRAFDYWLNSPQFILDQSAWAARLVASWIDVYGKEDAARMILDEEWVEPAQSLLCSAWGV